MKKLILILGIVILVLFNFGCTKNSGTEPEVVEYHKGTNGLEINIINNLPPDEIFKGNTFVIAIELENSGAFDIESGSVTINHDPKYISVSEPKRNFNIKGRQPGYPNGEKKVIDFQCENIGTRESSEETVISFTASAKYNYKTEASAKVCINSDIYDLIKNDDVCEVKSVSLSGGQGAPVAVTLIDEAISRSEYEYKVSFLFHISNKGSGRVIGPVKIKEAQLSNENLNCMQKEFKFDKNEETIIECSITLEDLRGSYLAPLSLVLEYEYETFKDHHFKVIDLLVKAKKI